MSVLKKLRSALIEKTSDTDMNSAQIMDFIDEYIEDEQKKYEVLKGKKAITFGKWRGFTVKEVAATAKGKDYLSWLISQTWCTEDKFQYIYDGCKESGVVKKKAR